ncbi:hypothetical protein [Clostridium rectalis]|uniref:hypothetical protein n=1 Tax=Clostridium rectalis TaxID=2040295 RepID=UPI000F63CE5F|nr:hypothetical protein [Clostridium rectalis]
MKKFLITMAAVLLIIIIYNYYPKSGSFNKLILNKYFNNEIQDIEICKGTNRKVVKSEDKINELMSYFKSLKLLEYKFRIPYRNVDAFKLSIQERDGTLIRVTIQNKNYITILVIDEYKQKSKKYKIIEGSINKDYIEKFYNECEDMKNTGSKLL